MTTKKLNFELPADKISKTTLRLNPKDTALFELIYINDTDQHTAIGKSYGDYDVEFMIFDKDGNQLNRVNGTACSSVFVAPGERIIISDFMTIIVQSALKEAKMDELSFGNYTIVWNPTHLGLNYSMNFFYDQGDIEYLIDYKNKLYENYRKSKNNKNK